LPADYYPVAETEGHCVNSSQKIAVNGTAYLKVPGFFEKSLKKVETRAISVV
jgi:hypothetical protein